jgi:hypothetical protein
MHLIVYREMGEIILFTFDAFILFFSQMFYTIVANYLNFIISKEKIFVDNESSVIRLILNVWSRVTR